MNKVNRPIHVVGLSTSPRLDGNSDLLLKTVLAAAQEKGAETSHLWIGHGRIGACTECNFCYSTGSCKIPDDFQPTMTTILSADRFVLATPIFFASVSAQAKLLIDRCQTYWARYHMMRQPRPRDPHTHTASLIAVGRTREPKQFRCLQETARSFFECLGYGPAPDLYVGGVVKRGDLASQTSELARARRLGETLVVKEVNHLRRQAKHAI